MARSSSFQSREELFHRQSYLVLLATIGTLGKGLRTFARTKPLGAAGALVLVTMIVMALGADLIAPYDPLAIDTPIRLSAPSWDHFFGTDQLGRDLLSRIIHATRPSLYTGLIVVTATAFLGTVFGVTSAYFGGPYDLLLQRVVDAFQALPGLIFAMALVSLFSSGIHIWIISLPVVWHTIPLVIVAVLIILMTPSTIRVVRAATFGVLNNPYVDAANVIGCTRVRIIGRHLVPNIMAPIIVVASVQLGVVILIEASLSFLGLGLPPPHPSWGGMLQGDGRNYMTTAPWLAIFPGLAITSAVLAFNLFGDGVRDVLDPRMRGTRGSGKMGGR